MRCEYEKIIGFYWNEWIFLDGIDLLEGDYRAIRGVLLMLASLGLA
jgi:hypothetical protein